MLALDKRGPNLKRGKQAAFVPFHSTADRWVESHRISRRNPDALFVEFATTQLAARLGLRTCQTTGRLGPSVYV